MKDMNASHKLIETMVLTHEELFDQPAPQVGGAGHCIRGGEGHCVIGREELLGVADQWKFIVVMELSWLHVRVSGSMHARCVLD